jgi:hypothetical protein
LRNIITTPVLIGSIRASNSINCHIFVRVSLVLWIYVSWYACISKNLFRDFLNKFHIILALIANLLWVGDIWILSLCLNFLWIKILDWASILINWVDWRIHRMVFLVEICWNKGMWVCPQLILPFKSILIKWDLWKLGQKWSWNNWRQGLHCDYKLNIIN